MSPDDLDRVLETVLNDRRTHHQLRQRIEVQPIDSTHVRIGDRVYTNFASNNYLGLTHHPRIRGAIDNALQQGVGSGAAGLISGYTDLHRAAEQAIATWKGTEAAVLLPSGYQANLSAIQTLAATGSVRFLVDKRVHASLIDATLAADAPMRVWPHNNLAKLRRLLAAAVPGQLQVVLTESIFSMDGDAADLSGLAGLKNEFPFVLLLDEAHGSGVYGQHGAGLAAERELGDLVDISIVTLSKALGCVGGAVCASQRFCDALINFGRAYIYSTSVPPMIAAAAKAAIEICHDEPQRQQRVRALASRVRQELTSAGLSIPAGDSPIVPIVVGDEQRAIQMSQSLRKKGLLVIAVRPPTVPRGSSRLRVTLSCEHSDAEVEQLTDELNRFAATSFQTF